MHWPAIYTLVASVLLVTVSLTLYQPATAFPFVWDTVHYLVYNEVWLSSLAPRNILWMFLSVSVWNWHPVTWLSWALDYQLYGGLSEWGFHFSNQLLHALNSVLVFLLCHRILQLAFQGSFDAVGRRMAILASAIAGLLFAVHPQHVEVVTWVAARQHLLCQAFLLLATLFYLKHASQPGNDHKRWLGGVTALFIFASLAKPNAIIFPFVLLLLDIYPLRRWKPCPGRLRDTDLGGLRVMMLEKRYLFLLAVLLVIPTLLARTSVVHDYPLYERAMNALVSSLFYLLKMVWPLDLSTYYPWFIQRAGSMSIMSLAAPVFFLVTTTLALIAWRKGNPAWFIAWIFYLLVLAPVSGLMPTGPQGGADRYAYLATLPAYLLAAAGLFRFYRQSRPWKSFVVTCLTLLVAVLLAGQARQHLLAWKSELDLWTTAYRLFPEDPFINHQLGAAMLSNGDTESAAGYFGFSARQDPDFIDPLAWYGLTTMELGRFEQALDAHLRLGEHAVSGKPPMVDEQCLVYNIAWTLAHMGSFNESIAQFEVLPVTGGYSEFKGTWLNWLQKQTSPAEEAGEAIFYISELPGPCVTPLTEMRRRPMTVNSAQGSINP